MASEDNHWIYTMKSKIEGIVKNRTWNLVDLPPGTKPIGLK